MNFSNQYCFYCMRNGRKGYINKDCNKLQAKGNLTANRERQSKNSDETNILRTFRMAEMWC